MIEWKRKLLWEKLQALEFPAGFAERLSKMQLWPETFAQQAIEEYRKFVFLAMVSGHPVTPSLIVDEPWHLHLIYTKSYWNDMCKGILKQSLHHIPGSGDENEEQGFRNQYKKTLLSYRKFFGKTPPRGVWPTCKTGLILKTATLLLSEKKISQ